jgi:hypothetical protein
MKFPKRTFLIASLFASASAYAGDCICFHYTLDKDGNQKFEGSHETDCGTHTHADSLSLSGPMFEPTVLQSVMRNSDSFGRIMASSSLRAFFWEDKDGNRQHCVVPEILRRSELQPARTASTTTTTIGFSLEKLPAAYRDSARLAANAWNIALAGLGKKTRLLEVSDNANVSIGFTDLSKLFGPTHATAEGVTFTPDPRLTSHPEWLVPFSQIVLNAAYTADFAADHMVPVQVFGHEFGHVLGLDHSFGHQLMAAGMQYTEGDEVVKMMAPGTYAPNLCEVAKAADNGLP